MGFIIYFDINRVDSGYMCRDARLLCMRVSGITNEEELFILNNFYEGWTNLDFIKKLLSRQLNLNEEEKWMIGFLRSFLSDGNDYRYENGQRMNWGDDLYYSNGQRMRWGNDLYYSNGERMRWGDDLYYSNGKHMRWGKDLYYSNGQHMRWGKDLYYRNGKKLRS